MYLLNNRATEQERKLTVKFDVIPHRLRIQTSSRLRLISRCAKKTSWRCCISGVRWTRRCPQSCFLLGLIQGRWWLHLLAVADLLSRRWGRYVKGHLSLTFCCVSVCSLSDGLTITESYGILLRYRSHSSSVMWSHHIHLDASVNP